MPAVRDLLKAFTDLAGAVNHDRRDAHAERNREVITGRGAEYVMTVKGNMPTLLPAAQEAAWARIPAASSVSKDHGRRSRRTIKAVLAPAWIEFAGAARSRNYAAPSRPRARNRRGRLPHHQ